MEKIGSELLGFFTVLCFLLESMINTYKFLLKLCGGNWLFVIEALSGRVNLLESMIKILELLLKLCGGN